MKVLAFGASYSPTSINQELARFAAKYFDEYDLEILNINQYMLPVFTASDEQVKKPPKAIFLNKTHKKHDKFIALTFFKFFFEKTNYSIFFS